MINEFLTAICNWNNWNTLKCFNPYDVLDAFLNVYSRPHPRYADFLILFSGGISIRKERKDRRFRLSQVLEKKAEQPQKNKKVNKTVK